MLTDRLVIRRLLWDTASFFQRVKALTGLADQLLHDAQWQ